MVVGEGEAHLGGGAPAAPSGLSETPEAPQLAPAPRGPEDIELDGALGRLEHDLAALSQALARFDRGEWGLCETCGADIAEPALREDPLQTRCDLHRHLRAPD